MLKEQLMEDFKNAMKEKHELKKNTIMMVRSAILQVEKDTQKELSENEIVEIISKELKKRKESVMNTGWLPFMQSPLGRIRSFS